jgi:hypothetical protein
MATNPSIQRKRSVAFSMRFDLRLLAAAARAPQAKRQDQGQAAD